MVNSNLQRAQDNLAPNLFMVDAFSDRPFAGNPAAVVVTDSALPDTWMQKFAAEMNQAETAFLVPAAEGAWSLRWFTPAVEVDLCGHATIASAHILWTTGRLPREESARFQTRSGLLTARPADADSEHVATGHIILEFPALQTTSVDLAGKLSQALSLEVTEVYRSRYDFLAIVADENALRTFKPDLQAIQQLECRGLIVSAACKAPKHASERSPDFVSRFFAPQAGVNEDPVTGSAHCVLAPFWSARLKRDQLLGYQASPRGGYVATEVVRDQSGAAVKVKLAGPAITVYEARIAIELG